MLDVLAQNAVLTLFLVVAAGSLVGLIPFGPIRFGPAGALFVGLLLGAFDERLGRDLGLVRTIGLALFVYTVGLASGPTLIRTFRRQAPLMLASGVVLALIAAATVAAGRILGIGGGFLGGLFAGVGTSTPTLAAATRAAGGGTDAAVGYALTYPAGVVLGIVLVHLAMIQKRRSPRDPDSVAAAGLTDLTVEVARPANLADVPGAASGEVRFSFWRHGDTIEVSAGHDEVAPGDRVVLIGPEEAVGRAVDWLGSRADEHLAHDRRDVDYRRVLLSNSRLAGRSVADLDIPGRFGGVVTRVRRGDLDLLAHDDLHLQLGDRLRVVVPRGRMGELTRLPRRHRAAGERGRRGEPRPRPLHGLSARTGHGAARIGEPVAGGGGRPAGGGHHPGLEGTHGPDRVEPADRSQHDPAPVRPAALPGQCRAFLRPRPGDGDPAADRSPADRPRRAARRGRSGGHGVRDGPDGHEPRPQRRPHRRVRRQPQPARVRQQPHRRRARHRGLRHALRRRHDRQDPARPGDRRPRRRAVTRAPLRAREGAWPASAGELLLGWRRVRCRPGQTRPRPINTLPFGSPVVAVHRPGLRTLPLVPCRDDRHSPFPQNAVPGCHRAVTRAQEGTSTRHAAAAQRALWFGVGEGGAGPGPTIGAGGGLLPALAARYVGSPRP